MNAKSIIDSNPRIGFTITPRGIENIMVLTGGGNRSEMSAGHNFCLLLDEEIAAFDEAIKRKLGDMNPKRDERMQ